MPPIAQGADKRACLDLLQAALGRPEGGVAEQKKRLAAPGGHSVGPHLDGVYLQVAGMVFDPVPVLVHNLERRPHGLAQPPFVGDQPDPLRPQYGGGIGGEEILLDRGKWLGCAGGVDLHPDPIKPWRKILRDLDRFTGARGEVDLLVDAGDAIAAPVEQASCDSDSAGLLEAEIREHHGQWRSRRQHVRFARSVEDQRDALLRRKLRADGEIIDEDPAGVGRRGTGIHGEVDAERVIRCEGKWLPTAGPARSRRRQREADLAPALPVHADGVLEFALGAWEEPVVGRSIRDARAIADERIHQHA